jgi:hypothetical protein
MVRSGRTAALSPSRASPARERRSPCMFPCSPHRATHRPRRHRARRGARHRDGSHPEDDTALRRLSSTVLNEFGYTTTRLRTAKRPLRCSGSAVTPSLRSFLILSCRRRAGRRSTRICEGSGRDRRPCSSAGIPPISFTTRGCSTGAALPVQTHRAADAPPESPGCTGCSRLILPRHGKKPAGYAQCRPAIYSPAPICRTHWTDAR